MKESWERGFRIVFGVLFFVGREYFFRISRVWV